MLDFWQAKSEKPTPLVLYIHGGGWQGGDKSSLGGAAIQQYLDGGRKIPIRRISTYPINGIILSQKCPIPV